MHPCLIEVFHALADDLEASSEIFCLQTEWNSRSFHHKNNNHTMYQKIYMLKGKEKQKRKMDTL